MLQRKILKNQWTVLRNTQWLSLRHRISGTSTNGMKAAEEISLCHCRSEWWIYMLSKMRTWFLPLFCLLRLKFLTRCSEKSVSSTRCLGSNSPLFCVHDSSRICQDSFSSRGIKDVQKETWNFSHRCPSCPGSPGATQPQQTSWLLATPGWCSPHRSGARGSPTFAASLCWPSLFSTLPT